MQALESAVAELKVGTHENEARLKHLRVASQSFDAVSRKRSPSRTSRSGNHPPSSSISSTAGLSPRSKGAARSSGDGKAAGSPKSRSANVSPAKERQKSRKKEKSHSHTNDRIPGEKKRHQQ